MSRFNNKFRKRIAGNVANHFDKYITFMNPVEFDVFNDVYRPHWPDTEWNAMQTLKDSKQFTTVVNTGRSFKVYTGDDSNKSDWQRNYVEFKFPKREQYPYRSIELIEQPAHVQDKIGAWVRKGMALRKLRGELYNRVTALVDWGWDANKDWDSYNGCWRGGPTPGMGCNTMGQVDRMWPELTAFFPVDQIARVRGMNQKSRLPKYIKGWGTPEQFMCEDRPYHTYRYECDEDDNGKTIWTVDCEDPFTDDEWQYAKRRLAAINHILVQMSLMKDVSHASDYPEVHVGR